MYTFGFSAMALATALALMAIVLQPMSWPARLLGTHPLVMIGRVSYGIYLFHLMVIMGVTHFWRLDSYSSIWRQVLEFIVILVFTSLIAGLHYFLIERRFLALREKLTFRPLLPGRVSEARTA
jgi:peptidoglycan/LPS O-acetylase OafA/YrhL